MSSSGEHRNCLVFFFLLLLCYVKNVKGLALLLLVRCRGRLSHLDFDIIQVFIVLCPIQRNSSKQLVLKLQRDMNSGCTRTGWG